MTTLLISTLKSLLIERNSPCPALTLAQCSQQTLEIDQYNFIFLVAPKDDEGSADNGSASVNGDHDAMEKTKGETYSFIEFMLC